MWIILIKIVCILIYFKSEFYLYHPSAHYGAYSGVGIGRFWRCRTLTQEQSAAGQPKARLTIQRGGDWKCGSGKCDTVKNAGWKMREQIAGVENAGVENAGADRRGGKYRSRQAVWKAEPILYIERPLIKLLPKNFPQTYEWMKSDFSAL